MNTPIFVRRSRLYAIILLASLICLILFGMCGYMILEGLSPLEALYITVGTLTTVAPFTLSNTGRFFTFLLIILGFGLVAATAGFFAKIILDGDWFELYRRRKEKKKIQGYKDHYVICGHGQVGQMVSAELHHHNLPLVVIDNDPEALIQCKEKGILHLERDAMEEENLIAAGVEKAKGLISVVNRDADNVFIVLTARSLNPELSIYARANTKGVEKKLIRAGADRVVSPYASAAVRITQNVLRPTVTDFLELALSGEGIELEMEELKIPEGASFVNKTLMDSGIRNDFDLIIVAINRLDGTRIYNPPPLESLHAGDTLIAIGPQANMDRFFEHLYGTPRSSTSKISKMIPAKTS